MFGSNSIKMKIIIPLLFIAFLIPFNTLAQLPGNVKGYEYWFKSNENQDSINKNENSLNFRSTKKIDYKNFFENIKSTKIQGEVTVFLVINPSFEQKSSVITDIVTDERIISIQSNKIESKRDLNINKYKSNKPFILSYIESIQPDSTLFNNSSINNNRFEGDIAEVILFPKLLSKRNRRKIETYLSLKHGISLELESDYINSTGDTIWKANENEYFPNRLTGIGLDYNSNFNNLQSSNSDLYQFLTINFEDKSINNQLNNHEEINYFLWSDNDGDIKFNNVEEDVLILDRIWLTKKIGDFNENNISIKYNLDFVDENTSETNDKEQNNDNEKEYWLIISKDNGPEIDFRSSNFIDIGKKEANSVIFQGVSLSEFNNYSKFTIAKAPELFAILQNSMKENCETDIKFKIIGGKAPYSISLYDSNNVEHQLETINNSEYLLVNPKVNDYTYYIEDSVGNKFKKNFRIGTEFKDSILIPNIFISKNQIKTFSITDFTNTDISKVSWLKNNRYYGSGHSLKIDTPGEYEVVYDDRYGCKKHSKFKVFEIPENDWTGIYPNPVKVNEDFFIKIPNETSSKIKVTIHDQSGKVLKETNINSNTSIYSDRFHQSGIYIITIESQNYKNQYTIVIK